MSVGLTRVGDSVTASFLWEDTDGAPLTALSPAPTATLTAPDGTITAPTIAQRGSSPYFDVTVTLSSAGLWAIQAQCTDTDCATPYTEPVGILATAESLEDVLDEVEAISAAIIGLSAGDVTVISPVDAADSTITIYRGDDYKAAESRRLSWTSSAWTAYNITGATILFSARYKRATGALFTKAGTVLDATTVAVELTNAETLALGLEGTTFAFDVQATLTNSDVVTLAWGDMFITPDVR